MLDAKLKTIAIVGLGYVGLPLAVAFSKVGKVIGFDVNHDKLECYKNSIDVTGEVGDEKLKAAGIYFTNKKEELNQADYIIIAVPTPVDENNNPNLFPLCEASRIVGEAMKKNTVVVYESTVYPGTTNEICIPILESASGFKCGSDFWVGYSPERINPGDKSHSLENITKIVSGINEETLGKVESLYKEIITAGVYCAPTIKVAEAAKILENTQRNINIAFINEMAMIFHLLEINTIDVLKAASTKWNFINFYPGLVGGHCIGVDPYYLDFKANEVGYSPLITRAARSINNSMGKYIANRIYKQFQLSSLSIEKAKILILGFTFKENINDIRNTKVMDIISSLKEYGAEVIVSDPCADPAEVLKIYNLELVDHKTVNKVDAIVIAVAHDFYKQMPLQWYKEKFNSEYKILFDVKGIFNKSTAESEGFIYDNL